jgi:hypothetical protein
MVWSCKAIKAMNIISRVKHYRSLHVSRTTWHVAVLARRESSMRMKWVFLAAINNHLGHADTCERGCSILMIMIASNDNTELFIRVCEHRSKPCTVVNHRIKKRDAPSKSTAPTFTVRHRRTASQR